MNDAKRDGVPNDELYRALFRNNHAIMLLVSPETGDIVDANPPACAFYGYEEETLRSMKMWDINILDKESVAAEMALALREKRNYFLFRHRLANGEIRDVEVYSGPVMIQGRQLLYSIIHDITDRRIAEARIKESEQSLRAILAASPIGICMVRNRTFEWVNDAMCRMTGYSMDEFRGRSTRFLFENDETYEHVGTVIYHQGWAESKFRRKDGQLIDALAQASKVDETSHIVSVTDITHRIRTEREQTKIGKLESLGVLAGGIAHDFNNMLTMILGNISLCKMYMAQDPSKAEGKLVLAENAIERAKNLTQQLLTFSRGGNPVTKVSSITEHLKNTAKFVLTGTGVTCKFEIADDLMPVAIDDGQMNQAIGHIVMNAYQAMPEGGSIHIRAQNISLDKPVPNLAAGRHIQISITDSGGGIPEEHIDRVFDPYFTTKDKGSGLGLAVCYSIIKNHHGHIAVESMLGIGSTFHIYLPVVEGEKSERKKGDLSVVKGARVLIMDDEETILDIVGDILNYHGFAVDFARNGEEALSLYREGNYDAVILDLTVPGGMGGKEAMKELLRIDPEVRAIVSSGYSNDPIMSDYRQHGFKDVIAKPFDIEELGQVLRSVISGN